jgi:DUF1365 family protein
VVNAEALERPALGTRGVPDVPAVIAGHVTHTRHVGKSDHFRYRSLQWLVDIDRLPDISVGRRRYDLRATDHLAGNGFRGDLADVLAAAGVQLEADHRVLMLAHPRSNGYVFDPLSVFWCFGPGSRLLAVVLEVHNTYGERHAYVLPGAGSSRVDKEFYVSPFNDTSGEYRVRLRLDPDRVQVTVNLHRGARLVLAATVGGSVERLSAASMRRAAKRVRGAPFRVPVLIRWRAILLWARRLPIRPRPVNGGNLQLRRPPAVGAQRPGCPVAPGSRAGR